MWSFISRTNCWSDRHSFIYFISYAFLNICFAVNVILVSNYTVHWIYNLDLLCFIFVVYEPVQELDI